MTQKIITTTGTKGKTSITRLLAQILHSAGNSTVRVDGHQVAINQSPLSSKQLEGFARMGKPHSLTPGRFLEIPEAKNCAVAVLEASIGSAPNKLGYDQHDIGIFTNIYAEHLSRKLSRLDQSDLAEAKSFIFSYIKPGGWAVFNADDPYVVSQLGKCKPGVKLLPFGQDFKFFDLKKHLKTEGLAIALKDNSVTLLKTGSIKVLIDANKLSWTFGGKYTPSVDNALAICAALVAFSGGKIPSKVLLESLKHSHLDSHGGRLELVTTKSGIKVLCDFAHEAVSLKHLLEFAKQMSKGKVIAVVRLSPRIPKLVRQAAEVIAKYADQAIVYNKYDGVFHKVRQDRKEANLNTAKLLAQMIEQNSTPAKLIQREDKALAQALSQARPQDTIVYLVHDDHVRSMQLLHKLI